MTESRGADGSVIETPVTLCSAWARMIPMSGSEKFVAAGITASIVYDVWVRWFAGLTSRCDFTYQGRVFTIEGLRNFDESNTWWVIAATEEVEED
jgi:SPP1 family predicted phage head-tail adaptor